MECQAHTREAENALHQTFAHLHILDTLTGHEGLVKRVAFSPDGRLMALKLGWHRQTMGRRQP